MKGHLIRCPLCMAQAAAMVQTEGHPNWRTLAEADRIVARALQPTRAHLAVHMVECHGWVMRLPKERVA